MDRTLHIFDFDDTLVTSDAEVIVIHANGDMSKLSSGEFATYSPLKGDKFDFSEFEIYPPGGKTIPTTFRKLKSIIHHVGKDNVVILTARSAEAPVRKFLSDNGVKGIQVVAVGSSNPADKGTFVAGKLELGEYSHVHVYEDNIKNVNAISNVAKEAGVGFSHTLVISEHIRNNDVTILRSFVREMIMERINKTPSAGIILIRDFPEGERVLGLQIEGQYDLPKGNIEPKESTFDAAIRETSEEAGITQVTFPYGHVTVQANHVTLYIGKTCQDPVILPNPESGRFEHESAAWLTWDQLKQNVKPYMLHAVIEAQNIIKDFN